VSRKGGGLLIEFTVISQPEATGGLSRNRLAVSCGFLSAGRPPRRACLFAVQASLAGLDRKASDSCVFYHAAATLAAPTRVRISDCVIRVGWNLFSGAICGSVCKPSPPRKASGRPVLEASTVGCLLCSCPFFWFLAQKALLLLTIPLVSFYRVSSGQLPPHDGPIF